MVFCIDWPFHDLRGHLILRQIHVHVLDITLPRVAMKSLKVPSYQYPACWESRGFQSKKMMIFFPSGKLLWAPKYAVAPHEDEHFGNTIMQVWFGWFSFLKVTISGEIKRFVFRGENTRCLDWKTPPKTNIDTQNSHIWKEIPFNKPIIFGSGGIFLPTNPKQTTIQVGHHYSRWRRRG